jgi:hypothetical protein
MYLIGWKRETLPEGERGESWVPPALLPLYGYYYVLRTMYVHIRGHRESSWKRRESIFISPKFTSLLLLLQQSTGERRTWARVSFSSPLVLVLEFYVKLLHYYIHIVYILHRKSPHPHKQASRIRESGRVHDWDRLHIKDQSRRERERRSLLSYGAGHSLLALWLNKLATLYLYWLAQSLSRETYGSFYTWWKQYYLLKWSSGID